MTASIKWVSKWVEKFYLRMMKPSIFNGMGAPIAGCLRQAQRDDNE